MVSRGTGVACVIGIDVGTQSIRALAFDEAGRKLASAARPTPIVAAETGGEHDPETIIQTVIAALSDVGRALAGRPVAGLAIASFGESCVLVGAGGEALSPAIAWFDRRTEAEARSLGAKIDPARLFAITGQPLDPTLTLCKLAWMRAHWPEAAARARRVLMMADWIAFRLCGEAATDPTLASRTLYFDIHQRRWSGELLALIGADAALPARLLPSGSALGTMRAQILAETGLAGRPVVAVGGHDHLVGSFAAGLVGPGTALDSLGTSEPLLLATDAPLGDPRLLDRGYFQGAIETDRFMSYLGGSIYSSGGAIEWIRALTGSASHAELIAEAEVVPAGSRGVLFLPHLANGPPPDPDPNARGAFLGLATGTTRGALFRAVLEGLALQSRRMLDGMTGFLGVTPPRAIRVIGGGSRNALFLSIKANAFARPITVVDEPEATALGAALLGGIAAGIWPNLDGALAGLDRREHVVEPDATADLYESLRTMAFERVHEALKPVNRGLADFQEIVKLRPG
jgi:xylulokinase